MEQKNTSRKWICGSVVIFIGLLLLAGTFHDQPWPSDVCAPDYLLYSGHSRNFRRDEAD